MTEKFPDYIVVEGPIGVGKTTLASRLAETFNVDLVLETVADNPFLPEFYRNPAQAALPTQLHFLFQRTKQIESLRQADLFSPARVTDFLIEKDRLFARATLSDAEYDLYMQVYNRLMLEPPVPDLVIYLQARPEILLERIYKRGIHYERYIDENYLKKISDAYIEFFYHYAAAPLLIINTENFDLVKGDINYDILLEHIDRLPPGRHYFNPQEL